MYWRVRIYKIRHVKDHEYEDKPYGFYIDRYMSICFNALYMCYAPFFRSYLYLNGMHTAERIDV